MTRLLDRVKRLPFGFGVTVALSAISLFNLQLIARSLPVSYPASDYKFAYAAAQAGFKFGWSRIYDLSLPRWPLTGVAGPAPSYTVYAPNPPPFVWLVAPFALLPATVGYVAWALLMLACLVVASQLLAGAGVAVRIRATVVMLALLPAMATVIFGQATALVVLALALCWVLARQGRETLAGAVLAIAVVKPHLVLLVPFTLLATGRWKVFAGWASAIALLAVVSIASLGVEGTQQYINVLTHFDSGQRGSYSLAGVLGSGILSLGARGLAVAVALAVAYLGRRDRGVTPAIAAGVAASLLVSGYLNAFDLAIYAAVILMLVREGAAWRLPLAISAVLWLALNVAITSGVLVVLLEVSFLLSLLQPVLPDLVRSRRDLALAKVPTPTT